MAILKGSDYSDTELNLSFHISNIHNNFFCHFFIKHRGIHHFTPTAIQQIPKLSPLLSLIIMLSILPRSSPLPVETGLRGSPWNFLLFTFPTWVLAYFWRIKTLKLNLFWGIFFILCIAKWQICDSPHNHGCPIAILCLKQKFKPN